MSILAASISPPSVTSLHALQKQKTKQVAAHTSPSSQAAAIRLVASTLGPVLAHALRLNQLLLACSLLVLIRSCIAVRFTLQSFLLAAAIIAARSLVMSRLIATCAASGAGYLTWSAWDSKPVRRLRKKVEFEFFVLLLGCGNTLFLMVFWPGWIPLGCLGWAVSKCLGLNSTD